MKWFEGSINEAVATSKSRKAIFVVFVEGKDDTSVQVATAINATEVSSKLEQDDFVAIRLESGTENCRLFGQIYQLVPVPSVFFIGANGIPLEIVAGTTTANDLRTKIETVLTKAGKNKTTLTSCLIDSEKKATASGIKVNIPSTSSKPATNLECDSTIKSNKDVSLKQETVETKVAGETEVENESSNVAQEKAKVESSSDDKPSNVRSASSEPQGASTKTLAAEENVKNAPPVIDIQPKNLIMDEGGDEILRGLENRKDLEMRQARQERLREKAQDAAAREKIRQQIAQDKLERKQKERDMQQQMQKQPHQEVSKQPVAPVASNSSNATVTRIQFRLPSGNPHMGQFESTNTLRDLRNYVVQNIDLPFNQFAMSISFPRRELTAEENDKTLLELELVPTAVVLILPLKNSGATTAVTSTQDVGFFSRIMWTVFTPIMHVYNYLMGYFSGGNQIRQRPGSPENNNTAESSDGTFMPNLQNVANSSGLVRRYLGDQGGTTIKTEGNIHRLHSGGDDNDENNTWNGNSTQQM